jgi:hypothetical protein
MNRLTLFGRPVKRVGTRFFAVQKPLTMSERIHAATLTGGRLPLWQRVMQSPVGSTVICNQKSAEGRRNARWARVARSVPFAGRS